MYSKEFRRPTPPKNYSGTAFRGGSPYITPSSDALHDTPPTAPHPESIQTLSPALPPPDEDSNTDSVRISSPEPDDRGNDGTECPGCRRDPPAAPPEAHQPPDHGLLSALIPPGLVGSTGSGLGFEELLLTGLILLLAQSDRDSDLVLMLALLLLYQ